MHSEMNLQHRSGSKPDTTSSLPHSQLNQHGPDVVVAALHTWCFSLPLVQEEDSGISVPGSRALVLHDSADCNHAAFMIGREFAHIHPHPDNGSMHVQLPPEAAREVIEAGWGESHYLVTEGRLPFGLVLVFSPRDEMELEVVKTIVRHSYEYATGQSSQT
ncbi:luciferase family protein [Roseibium sp. HPY-6]|uniref:luciferase domain-containing protein n=1 Tax=Roseibium sp. HPY-6 TaxID=3229852 RepID=UPI00338F26CB